MTLGDISNLMLTTLQQPGASFTVGGGGGPNWASITTAQYGQGYIEFCINEGYKMAMGDLWDLQLSLVTFTLTSTAQTYKYAIPPVGNAPISHIARVFYQPSGLPYSQEFRPGTGLISWDEFQGQYSGEGYLAPYAFGNQPRVCTVDPTLSFLYFYEGSANAGDTITVDYQPLPGGTSCPLLTSQTMTPLMPADTHMLIFYFAMSLAWFRAREAQMALTFYNPDFNKPSLYGDLLKASKFRYTRKHAGEIFRLEPFQDALALNSFSM